MARGLKLLLNMWNLPRPGIKPMPPALADRFLFTAHQENCICRFFNLGHSDWFKVVPHCILVLICIPVISDAEHLFHVPIGHLYVFFQKCLFRSSAHFSFSLSQLQETWTIQNKITDSSTKIKIFIWSFNIKLSKIIKMNIQKSRSTMNQFNMIKIYSV